MVVAVSVRVVGVGGFGAAAAEEVYLWEVAKCHGALYLERRGEVRIRRGEVVVCVYVYYREEVLLFGSKRREYNIRVY